LGYFFLFTTRILDCNDILIFSRLGLVIFLKIENKRKKNLFFPFAVLCFGILRFLYELSLFFPQESLIGLFSELYLVHLLDSSILKISPVAAHASGESKTIRWKIEWGLTCTHKVAVEDGDHNARSIFAPIVGEFRHPIRGPGVYW